MATPVCFVGLQMQPQLHQQLEALAAIEDTTVSAVIRRLIEQAAKQSVLPSISEGDKGRG